jgi:hypothetical protein
MIPTIWNDQYPYTVSVFDFDKWEVTDIPKELSARWRNQGPQNRRVDRIGG